MNTVEKLEMARQLARLNVDVIEAGFPISSDEDFEATREVARQVGTLDGAPMICGLSRVGLADIDRCWEAVKYARRPRIHTFVATSDIHLKYKLRKSRAEVMKAAVEAVRHARAISGAMARLKALRKDELVAAAKELGAPLELVRQVAEHGALPVVNFAAGGIATPADAALMMQLGVDGVFVGSGIFKSEDPASRARAIVEATTYFSDPEVLAKVSRGLGEPMRGLDIKELGADGLLQVRGW